MKELQKKLEKTRHLKIDDFKTEMTKIIAKYNSPDEQNFISSFFKKDAKKTIEQSIALREEISLKIKLKEITEIIAISYIAKNYFKKSRQWFYQRLNGNLVNGNSAKFTKEELNTLDFALKDISNKIGSISIL